MNKWFVFGVIMIILIGVGTSVYVINEAVDAGRVVHERYLDVGITKTPLIEITDVTHYYGTEHLIILFGKDEYEKEMVVWMNEDLTFLRHAWLDQGVSKEFIQQNVLANYGVNKEIKITPGVENNLFLWEAVYLTNQGEYLYVYYDFFTGELLRSIKLRDH